MSRRILPVLSAACLLGGTILLWYLLSTDPGNARGPGGTRGDPSPAVTEPRVVPSPGDASAEQHREVLPPREEGAVHPAGGPPPESVLLVVGTVKEAGGAGIPAAHVRVRLRLPDIPWKGEWKTCRADGTGRFTLSLPFPGGEVLPPESDTATALLEGEADAPLHLRSSLLRDGLIPYLFTVHPAHAGRKEIAFVLEAGAEVTGRVLDAQGAPVKGARVRLEGAVEGAAVSEIRTGVEGRFVFPVPGEGRFFLRAVHPEIGRSQVETCDLDPGLDLEVPDLVLYPGGLLAGRVIRPDGTPEPGAEILAVPASCTGMTMAELEERLQGGTRGQGDEAFSWAWTQAGPGGEFRIASLSPGRYFLLARSPGPLRDEVSEVRGPTYPTGTEGIDVVLESYTLLFCVRDLSGEPVEDASCTVEEWRSGKRVSTMLAKVEPGGEYTRMQVHCGSEVVLQAVKGTRLSRKERVQILPGNYETRVVLLLSPADESGTVCVRLEDESGGRVSSFDGFVAARGAVAPLFHLHAEHTCRLQLPPGRYRFHVEGVVGPGGYGLPTEREVTVVPGRTQDVTLRVRTGGRLAVRVHGSAVTGPVVPRSFTVERPGGGEKQEIFYTCTNEEGLTQFHGPLVPDRPVTSQVLPPGTYRLRLRCEGFLPVDRVVEVLPGRDTEVAVELRPEGE